MKALLALLLIISVAVNVVLLVGCSTTAEVSTKLFVPPKPLEETVVDELVKSLTDDQRPTLKYMNSWLDERKNKFVIVLDDTPEIRDAKKIIVHIEK